MSDIGPNTGLLFSWGANNYGQLGIGQVNEQCELPTQVQPFLPLHRKIRKIAGGGGHSLILDDAGSLWATGWNHRGQLGLGDTLDRQEFCPVPGVPPLVDICGGWDFTIALGPQGEVYVCGSNKFSQLGIPEEASSSFVNMSMVPKASSVAAGMRHSLILTESGHVFGCGSNKKGQLALDTNLVRVPTQISLPEPAMSVAAGQNFSIFRLPDGVVGCGDNKHGQISGPDRDPTWTRVHTGPCEHISSGWSHIVIQDIQSRLWTQGRNTYGQLGRRIQESDTTLQLPDTVVGVAAGYEHNLLLTSEGCLMAWGWNEHGNCGNGGIENLLQPHRIELPIQVTHFAALSGHSFAYGHPIVS